MDDVSPSLPHFGLTVRVRRQAYDEHGNRIDYAIFPGDVVVSHLDIKPTEAEDKTPTEGEDPSPPEADEQAIPVFWG